MTASLADRVAHLEADVHDVLGPTQASQTGTLDRLADAFAAMVRDRDELRAEVQSLRDEVADLKATR